MSTRASRRLSVPARPSTVRASPTPMSRSPLSCRRATASARGPCTRHELPDVLAEVLTTTRAGDAACRDRSPPVSQRRSYEMTHPIFPSTTGELASHRTELAPETYEAFQAFSKQVFADGALPEKTKQLIAVAVAHVTQCPYCIRSHTRIALRKGATEPEIMEAIWVAAEMRAGGAYAHSVIALDAAGSETDGR